MKKLTLLSFFLVAAFTFTTYGNTDFTKNFIFGNIEMNSVNSLAFGPDGILFIGDPIAAVVFALDTKDKTANDSNEAVAVKDIDKKIAALLGIGVEDITIHDLATNPISKNVYLSVSRMDIPLILRIMADGNIEEVSLEKVLYSKIELLKPVEEKKDRRGRNLRNWAITDLAYSDGKLFIAGLSNEEFASTFRTIPFPFDKEQTLSSIEIYHAAHGRYETHAPIKTFMPYTLGGEPHIIASYTCTPLVIIPVAELQNGKHVMGKTVAEMGNRNTPLDIIHYEKNDKPYILIGNSNRTLMKIDPNDIPNQQESLKQKVSENGGTAGIPYIALAEIGVQHLDNLNKDYIVMIQRSSNGSLNLRSVRKNRL